MDAPNAELADVICNFNDSLPDFGLVFESNYYSFDEFNKKYSDNTRNLRLFHINVRSLLPKQDDIGAILSKLGCEFDILCFTETWLSDATLNLVNFGGYISFNTVRRHGLRGGGVSIFVKDNFQCRIIDSLSKCEDVIETVFVEGQREHKKILVGCIYRPPGGNSNEFLLILEDILSNISTSAYESVILAGDFNYNLLNAITDIPCSDFLNIMFLKSYSPSISKPTRITDVGYSLIDNIFTNNITAHFSGIIPCSLSDHYIIFYILHDFYEPRRELNKTISYRLHTSHSIERLFDALITTDFDLISRSGDVNCVLPLFLDTIMSCYNECCPIVSKVVSHKDIVKPWIDRQTRENIRKRENLFLLYRAGKIGRLAYTRFRNMVTRQIRDKRSRYYERKFTEFKGNMSKTWSVIKKI